MVQGALSHTVNEGGCTLKLLKQVKLCITFSLCLLEPWAKRCAWCRMSFSVALEIAA